MLEKLYWKYLQIFPMINISFPAVWIKFTNKEILLV